MPPALASPEEPAPAVGPVRWTLVGAAFLASGAAALVYQVVWQRILALHTGIGITSIALIVSAFMAGLGLGSHAGGVMSARVGPRAALLLFAAIELLVGLFAAVSCRLYYEVPERFLPGLYRSTAGMGLAHFMALVVPTALMGMSLPFLVRAMVRDTATASRTIATLYGINVLGASLGALVTPWLLIRFQGMEGAVLWGVAGNALAGVAALVAGARAQGPVEARTEAPAVPTIQARPSPAAGASSLALWTGLYALSGFTALSLEILWFRLIDVSVKSTAFTFGTVLFIYLLGLATGSLVGAWNASRFRRPLRAFLSIQLALLAYSVLAVAALARLPKDAPAYRWFFGYWAHDAFFQLGADWNLGTLLRLYLLLPVALYGPPTVLMGLAFTALQRAVQDDPRTSGRKVGVLQAANIAGCVAGSLLVGLVFLDRLGTTGSLKLLLALGIVFLAVLARHAGPRAALPWAAVGVAALLALPGQDALWTRLHGVTDESRPSFIGEDATAVSAVTPGQPGHWRVTVNGLPH
ncbi:MAG TPA: spermidine synthase, partial [Vicinamibacteria bacterium]|nr:spermidine synthase [Vicinamibacteria bacterium]